MTENMKAPRHWPLCGEFIGTDEFPAQRASNAENVPIWWRHHGSKWVWDGYPILQQSSGKAYIHEAGKHLTTRHHQKSHDVVIKWKHFPRYWPFVGGIRRSPMDSIHKSQWRGAFMFPLICAQTNDSANNGDAGDLRRHHVHYDLIVMVRFSISRPFALKFDKLIWGDVTTMQYSQHTILRVQYSCDISWGLVLRRPFV